MGICAGNVCFVNSIYAILEIVINNIEFSFKSTKEVKQVMSNKITGKEYPLSKIFSPGYQRPYAWTEEQAGILFDDLYDFFQTETIDNYFLGSIVLIKEENKPYADVIDGQQRLTTLSILFSVMADAFSTEENKNEFKIYLQEKGSCYCGHRSQKAYSEKLYSITGEI